MLRIIAGIKREGIRVYSYVIQIHPEGTINVGAKFNGNAFNSGDISFWTNGD